MSRIAKVFLLIAGISFLISFSFLPFFYIFTPIGVMIFEGTMLTLILFGICLLLDFLYS